MSMQNVKTVQDIYAAFGRGDLATILGHVTEDTRWGFNGGRGDLLAYHRPVAGKAELPRFFQAIGETVEFSAFEPREFIDAGPHVVVEVLIAFKNKRTGRSVDQSQLHWWTFEGDKVARLVHYEDTAQVLGAA